MTYLAIPAAIAVLFVLASIVGKRIKAARIEQFGKDPDNE